MRWSYLIPRVLVLSVMVAYVAYGLDPSLRATGRMGLTGVTGRAAEIGDLTTRLWPPSIVVDTLDVADADARTAELRIGRTELTMDADALRHRRAVVDRLVITDVAWDVPADFDVVEPPAEEAPTEPGWSDALLGKGKAALAEQAALIEGRLRERLDPEQLETVRIARSKEATYRSTLDALTQEYQRLRAKADALRTIASDRQFAQSLILEPQRVEQIAADAAATRQRLRELKERLALLRRQLPVDVAELNAAKNRDVENLRSEWTELKAAPLDAASLIVGDTTAGVLQQLATWWPKWRSFREASEWNEVQHVRGRGRDIAFIPPHRGPNAGINHMTLSGLARRDDRTWPFRCEIEHLHYPPQQHDPATFRWTSGGDTPIEAIGTVAIDDSGPRLRLQFRLTSSTAVERQTDLGRAGLTFHSDPPIIEGTLMAGDAFDGTCRIRLPAATARFRCDNELLAPLLRAMDVDAAELTPLVRFAYDGGRPDCDLTCPQLADVGETWKHSLRAAASDQVAKLESQAADIITSRLDRFGGLQSRLAELSEVVPGLDIASIPGVTADGKIDVESLRDGSLRDAIIQRAGYNRSSGGRAGGRNRAANLLDRVLK